MFHHKIEQKNRFQDTLYTYKFIPNVTKNIICSPSNENSDFNTKECYDVSSEVGQEHDIINKK